MLNNLANLSDDYELFILWTSQSTGRPWGTMTELTTLFSDFDLAQVGINLTAITIPNHASTRVVNEVEVLTSVSPSLSAGEWNAGAHIRFGTVAAPEPGYARIISNTATTITVEWLALPTNDSTSAAIITRENYKWASHAQVRMLTPFQPTTDNIVETDVEYPDPAEDFAGGGMALTLPSPYTKPAGITSFADQGLLLPLTTQEGIAGFGISEVADSLASPAAHPITIIASTGTVWTFTGTITHANLLMGGKLVVDWEDGGVMKRSWADIVSSTSLSMTMANWTGDGAIPDSGGAAKVKRYTAFVPHWQNSPHAWLGDGFSYPNNDSLPCWWGYATGRNAVIRNSARGNNVLNYEGDKVGDILVMATRLSMATGKRINVAACQVNAAKLSPSAGRNVFAAAGQVGWFDHQDGLTFAPGVPSSAFARVKNLIENIVPNAMAAEGNTRTPAFLMHVHPQGESDAGGKSSRQHYASAINGFVTKVRAIIEAKGYSPYANGAKIPFVQPRIAYIPYCLVGSYNYYGSPQDFDGDVNMLVNNAIVEHAAADGFAEWIDVDDLPRILTDPGHYNGVGHGARAHRIAAAGERLINYALGFGSPALLAPDPVVDLCNEALRAIGAQTITSFSDGSKNADSCADLYPQARDELLQIRQWSFAQRRMSLTEVRMPEMALYNHFSHCYVVPPQALNGFAVVERSELSSYAGTFRPADPLSSPILSNPFLPPVWSPIFATAFSAEDEDPALPVVDVIRMPQHPFRIEGAPGGSHRYIFTNVEQATLQFTSRATDATQYPPLFRAALVLWLGTKLCPSTITGPKGEQVGAEKSKQANAMLKLALASDGNQQRQVQPVSDASVPPHMTR